MKPDEIVGYNYDACIGDNNHGGDDADEYSDDDYNDIADVDGDG